MMDWTERFERLTAPQRLGVVAVAAERVLPLAPGFEALDDALRLVWLQLEGRRTTKTELTSALNLAIESASTKPEDRAGILAARATFAVVEAALGKSDGAARAVTAVLDAARELGAKALEEERDWLDWALDVAAGAQHVTRATFRSSEAPTVSWTAKVSSQNLPLFRSNA